MNLEELKAEKEQKIITLIAVANKRFKYLESKANPHKKAFRRQYDRRPVRIRNMDKSAAMFALWLETAQLRAQIEIILSTPLPRYTLGKHDSGFINTPNTENEQIVYRPLSGRISIIPEGIQRIIERTKSS